MKMIENLKEEIKNSFKIEKTTKKKLEEINKSLKETQEHTHTHKKLKR